VEYVLVCESMTHYTAHYDSLDDVWVVDTEERPDILIGTEVEARVCAWALDHVSRGGWLPGYQGPTLELPRPFISLDWQPW